MKKTLIHIIPTLKNGGAETVLTRLVEEFSKDNVEQIVVTLEGIDSDFYHKNVSLFAKVFHLKHSDFNVVQWLNENPTARIIAWMYKPIFFAQKWKLQSRSNPRVYWNIRNSNFRFFQIRQRFSLYAFGLISHVVRPYIIFCSHQAKKVHNNCFFSQNNQCVIPNRWAKELDNLPRLTQPDTPTFLYVGRYDVMKGPKRLIRLFKTFVRLHPTAKLNIAGRGWTNKMIPSAIQDKVTLLGNTDKIYEHYSSASALLFTSYSEGYPNVLVEAMVSGLPIIAFEAGDSKRILQDYPLGYTVKSKRSFLLKMEKMSLHPFTINERNTELLIQKEKLNFIKTVEDYQKFLSL